MTNKNFIILIVIIILGLSLRLVNLGVEPYWGDEILSLSIVKHYGTDITGLIHYLREVEVHPPLYYVLLTYWTKVFGFSEFFVRVLSMIFGVGIIWIVYFFGKKIYSSNFGLISALMVAISPIQIEFSQEARPYIIMCFFGLVSTICLWDYLLKKGKKYLVIFCISSLIGIYLHYSYFFLFSAHISFWLGYILLEKDKIRHNVRGLFISLSFIFIGFYWWLVPFLYKLLLSDVALLGADRTFRVNRSINYFESTINQLIWLVRDKQILPIEILAIIIFKLFFFICLFGIVIQLVNQKKTCDFFKSPVSYFLWITILPIILFLFSSFSYPYGGYLERHIIFCSISLIYLLAWIITRTDKKKRILLLILFVASVMNLNIKILSDNSIWNPQHRLKVICNFVNENFQKNDMVITYFSHGRTDINYYLDKDISTLGFYPTKLLNYSDDYLASRETLGFLENESQLRIVEPTAEESEQKLNYLYKKFQPKRIWVLFNGSQITNWMQRNNWRHAIVSGGDLFPLDLYVKQQEYGL